MASSRIRLGEIEKHILLWAYQKSRPVKAVKGLDLLLWWWCRDAMDAYRDKHPVEDSHARHARFSRAFASLKRKGLIEHCNHKEVMYLVVPFRKRDVASPRKLFALTLVGKHRAAGLVI